MNKKMYECEVIINKNLFIVIDPFSYCKYQIEFHNWLHEKMHWYGFKKRDKDLKLINKKFCLFSDDELKKIKDEGKEILLD